MGVSQHNQQARALNSDKSTTWDWEKTDPNRSGSSGDISKLFRHERAKNPGVLSIDAPSPDATIMAREVIQNSWDAARDLHSSFGGEDKKLPTFEMEFDFRSVREEEKARIANNLDLESLSSRLSGKDRQDLGLRQSDCLKHLSSSDSLPLLYVHESGTTGMYGPWRGAESKMYQALVSIGYTDKEEGAGGSYGYGKAGLIRASATRSVVAYTCFREREDDPGVTRRLLGMTYWGQHIHREESYTGFARMADEDRRPFENDRADQIAEQLGIETRDPENPKDLGTTFLLVDPTVRPCDLKKAVERWWWPAIDNGDFFISITSADGKVSHPRPKKNPSLQPFIRAHEIATTPQDNSPKDEKKVDFNRLEEGSNSYDDTGSLGLVADLDGWSYADQTSSNAKGGEPVEHRSLVALMRKPNMVVEYYDAGQTQPYVRGAFVAGDDVNEVLRRTEPKGHDAWRTTSDEGEMGEHAADVAQKILRRIRANVNNFRRSLKPPSPQPEDIQLSHFDKIMRRVMTGGSIGDDAPPASTRPISIRFPKRKLESAGEEQVRYHGLAKLSLSDHFEGDKAEISVKIKFRFIEDDRLGSTCPIEVTSPNSFTEQDGDSYEFRGIITRGEEAEFSFVSVPYSSNWTTRLIVNADVIEENIQGQTNEH
jgi:hypothetical protein